MKKSFFVFLTVAFSVISLAGCATTGSRYAKSLDPGVYEDCFEMNAGQIVDYSFESEKPVNFNIHYHEDGQINYPVSADNVSSKQGSYTAEKKQYYCIMITNPYTDSVGCTYKYTVKDK